MIGACWSGWQSFYANCRFLFFMSQAALRFAMLRAVIIPGRADLSLIVVLSIELMRVILEAHSCGTLQGEARAAAGWTWRSTGAVKLEERLDGKRDRQDGGMEAGARQGKLRLGYGSVRPLGFQREIRAL